MNLREKCKATINVANPRITISVELEQFQESTFQLQSLPKTSKIRSATLESEKG